MTEQQRALLEEAANSRTSSERLDELRQLNEELARTVAGNPSLDERLLWTLVSDYPLTVLGNPRFQQLMQEQPNWWETAPLDSLLALLAVADPDLTEEARAYVQQELRESIPDCPEIRLDLTGEDVSVDPLEVELSDGDVHEFQLVTTLAGTRKRGSITLDSLPEDPVDFASLVVALTALRNDAFSFPQPPIVGVTFETEVCYEDVREKLRELADVDDEDLEECSSSPELILEHVSPDLQDFRFSADSFDTVIVDVCTTETEEEHELELSRDNGRYRHRIDRSSTCFSWDFPLFRFQMQEGRDGRSDAELLFRALVGSENPDAVIQVSPTRFRARIADDGSLCLDSSLVQHLGLDLYDSLLLTPAPQLLTIAISPDLDDEDEDDEDDYGDDDESAAADALTLTLYEDEDLVLEAPLLRNRGFRPGDEVSLILGRDALYLFPTPSDSDADLEDDDDFDEE